MGEEGRGHHAKQRNTCKVRLNTPVRLGCSVHWQRFLLFGSQRTHIPLLFVGRTHVGPGILKRPRAPQVQEVDVCFRVQNSIVTMCPCWALSGDVFWLLPQCLAVNVTQLIKNYTVHEINICCLPQMLLCKDNFLRVTHHSHSFSVPIAFAAS